jgi:hypothetical protein
MTTPFPPNLFDRSVASIERAYKQLGHTIGWRFLTGPRATLSPNTTIGFVTLNPGGNSERADHPRASSEAGSAYLIETWPGSSRGAAPLQVQVQALSSSMARHLGYQGSLSTFMNQRVLSSHLIPFRSPRLADLPRRSESTAFAVSLWTDILTHWRPRILLTIDTEAFKNLNAILLQQPGARQTDSQRFDTGWGTYQAEAVRLITPGSSGALTLARLPHLSTFRLFSRAACGPISSGSLPISYRATRPLLLASVTALRKLVPPLRVRTGNRR